MYIALNSKLLHNLNLIQFSCFFPYVIIWITYLGPNNSGLKNSYCTDGPAAKNVLSSLKIVLIFVASDVMLYIYTSGTTGMPKAAIITCAR